MKLNLRKARKLEEKIRKYVESGDTSFNFRVRIKEDPEKVVSERYTVRQKVLSDVQDLEKLIELRYTIRNNIGTNNETSGINSLISQRAMLESKYKFFKNDSLSFMGGPVVSDDEIRDTLEIKVNAAPSKYGNTDVTATFCALTDEDLDNREEIRKAIKRELEDIDDKLSAKNLNTTIELDNNQVTLLKLHGLV